MDYKFSHIGIPTTEEKKWDGYCASRNFHYTDFSKDEYKVEWVKFDENSDAHVMVKTFPHVSYFVDEIEDAIKGKELLGDIFSLAEGIRVVYVNQLGFPVEFLEISE
ncbi:hypothetical protein Q4566_13540 [Tamlana sp. 2_MG-2023]|uniref:hypothetical protein n=1 Tax=unclassified Tamlana TaxID=2614803 RepID=UPI0026E3ABCB|nr:MULTISPECIES: hypothetical protein [unclassified Tamlana]MDO6761229.1 hypothetical protein [Tamlana sp. 2_MG-2023]MDO6791712.1 hypothetical protein [Tamlana sp. 1_MG-2023]